MSGADDEATLDHRPPTFAVTLSTLAAGVAVAGLALGGPALAMAPAVVGLLAVVVGSAVASRRTLTLGVVALLGGVAVAGVVADAAPETVLVAVAGSVLAWDLGQHGIEVGAQLGREAPSTRLVAVHAAGSLLVACVTAALAYGVFRGATGGQPVTAVVFLLLGVVGLVAALR